MKSWLSLVVFCAILCLQVSCLRFQDDRGLDSQVSGLFIYDLPKYQYVPSGPELASWLLELAQRNDHAHKRNSEIINSLLGLPKVLNDAGRK